VYLTDNEKNKREKTMKLAEALINRKDLEVTIVGLQQRMKENVRVQEGTEPFEKVEVTAVEVKKVLAELEKLVLKINRTNNATKTDDEMSLNELIAKRDMIKSRHKVFDEAYKEACIKDRWSGRGDIKYILKVDVKMLLNEIAEAAKEYRALDTKIQNINWATELL
jgi:hypothetical protein